MKIIDGKRIAEEIIQEIRAAVSLKTKKPGIAFLLVGDHPPSQSYVRAKKKACASTGITSILLAFPATVSESELLHKIEELNHDPAIDAILVQLPLPPHIDPMEMMLAIDPRKDVDGFHPINVGKMLLGNPSALLPCTPSGIQVLLQKSQIPVEGKHVVIVGRSNIVGKPLAAILMQKKKGCNATVTICHSQSQHLEQITATADILVAAIGIPAFIQRKHIKPGAAVIDVGINRVGGKVVGDVDFQGVYDAVSRITPVPGGVGPMTIAMLLKNTLHCAHD